MYFFSVCLFICLFVCYFGLHACLFVFHFLFLQILKSSSDAKTAREWTVGNIPLVSAVERSLLLNQFSGWSENQTREVPLAVGETLPDIWARTAREYPTRTAILSVVRNRFLPFLHLI